MACAEQAGLTDDGEVGISLRNFVVDESGIVRDGMQAVVAILQRVSLRVYAGLKAIRTYREADLESLHGLPAESLQPAGRPVAKARTSPWQQTLLAGYQLTAQEATTSDRTGREQVGAMRIAAGQTELKTAREDLSSFVESEESGFELSRPAGDAQSGRVERLS